jgi:rod shape-determining protein MreB
MLNTVLGAFSADMAIDPGTSMLRIAVRGRGVVSNEPNIAAILEHPDGRGRILAMGQDAQPMAGRAPSDVRVVRPVQDGTVVDFEVLEAMLRVLMLQVQGRRLWVRPRVAVAVPCGLTELELRGVRELIEAAGAREVVTVEQPVACALGAGLPVDEACGQMVVDIGAGRATVTVISLGGVVYSRSLQVGGNHMDDALRAHVRACHDLVLPRADAERARVEVGSAVDGDTRGSTWVCGRHVSSGFPRALELDTSEVAAAVHDPMRQLGEAVLGCLERIAPDLAADVAETGVVLTGGVAAMPGVDHALGMSTGLPVVVAESPETATVRGAAAIWELPDLLRQRSRIAGMPGG